MPQYTLASPIPAITSLGSLIVGVGNISGRAVWKDGAGAFHFLGGFGGNGGSEGSDFVYINLTTGVPAFCPGVQIGSVGGYAYSASNDKIYGGTGYANHTDASFFEFDSTTQTLTLLRDHDLEYPIGGAVIGGDGLVYQYLQGGIVISYDSALGMPAGWLTYDIPEATGQIYRNLLVDATHIYLGLRKNESTWTLYITAIGDTSGWVEWEFGDAGDTNMTSGQEVYTYNRFLTRTLAAGGTLTYWLSGGTYTPIPGWTADTVTALHTYILASDGYLYECTARTGDFKTGLTEPPAWTAITVDNHVTWERRQNGILTPNNTVISPYCYSGASEVAYSWFETYWGWEFDMTDFIPLIGVQEYSRIKYRQVWIVDKDHYIEPTPDWITKDIAYTGAFVNAAVGCALPRTAAEVLCYPFEYMVVQTFDMNSLANTTLGIPGNAPYAVMQHPGGEIYMSGYSNRFCRYDPTQPYTLNSGNSADKYFTDVDKPNPYFIKQSGSINYNYRHCLAYDAADLVWVGGNTTRSPNPPGFNTGNIMWYNPANGDTDYVCDSWEVRLTGLTVTVDAVAKTFTRSTGSWLDDGVQTGFTLNSSGFSNSGNNLLDSVAQVTDSIITLTTGTGLVNEGPTASISVNVGCAFRNMTAAANHTKIVAASNDGRLTVIDTATKAIDGTYNLGTYAYMADVGGVVIGVTPGGNIFRFNPITRTMLTEPTAITTLGAGAGTPFGFGNNEYNRMYYNLVVGPDNFLWMYVGNVLYRINPTTLAFSSVGITGTYGKIAFVNGNRDLLWFAYDTTVKYYPNIFSRIDSRIVCGARQRKVSNSFARKVNNVLQ